MLSAVTLKKNLAKYLNAFYKKIKSCNAKIERNQSKTCGVKPHRLDPGLTIVTDNEYLYVFVVVLS